MHWFCQSIKSNFNSPPSRLIWNFRRPLLMTLIFFLFLTLLNFFIHHPLGGVHSSENSSSTNDRKFEEKKQTSLPVPPPPVPPRVSPNRVFHPNSGSKKIPSIQIADKMASLRRFSKLFQRHYYGIIVDKDEIASSPLNEAELEEFIQLTANNFDWLIFKKDQEDSKTSGPLSSLDKLVESNKKNNNGHGEQQQQQRGIVIVTGEKYFPMAVHAIRTIRYWNCQWPIEVWYIGDDDLSPIHQEAFRKLDSGVKTVDATTIFNNDILKLSGWDVKPFAMLGSAFSEVILMDADAVWMQPPEMVFNTKEYQETGTLFFADRTLHHKHLEYDQWFAKILPSPLSASLQATRMYKKETDYEMESGVVVMDKSRVLIGLLIACRLNRPDIRSVMHKWTYGDKETFWIGFEAAGVIPYAFHSGAVGSVDGQCGHLGHFIYPIIDGSNSQLPEIFWFNDGVVKNKAKSPWTLLAEMDTVSIGNQWAGLCMKAPEKSLTLPQKVHIEAIKDLWNPEGFKVEESEEQTSQSKNEEKNSNKNSNSNNNSEQ